MWHLTKLILYAKLHLLRYNQKRTRKAQKRTGNFCSIHNTGHSQVTDMHANSGRLAIPEFTYMYKINQLSKNNQ
jgi:hypothetical protein